MTDEIRPRPLTDEAVEQQAEQERLDEETRRQVRDDPGDPRDRLPENEHDRLMQQATYRELHP
jgi:hypothetical protein